MRQEKLLKKINLYLEGELDSSEMRKFEEYLKSCPDCMKEVEKYRKLIALTKTLAKFTPQPPPDLEKKIMLQITRIEKEKRFLLSHFVASMATLAIILSILYIPGMLNITGEITPQHVKTGSVITSSLNSKENGVLYSPPPSAIETARKQFDLYTARFNPDNTTKRITYIIPITSSSSWQKVATYLKNFGNNYKVAIKPIIRDRTRNYSDVMAQLQRVKSYNPYVQIEDVSFNPGYSSQHGNGAGVILQISVER